MPVCRLAICAVARFVAFDPPEQRGAAGSNRENARGYQADARSPRHLQPGVGKLLRLTQFAISPLVSFSAEAVT